MSTAVESELTIRGATVLVVSANRRKEVTEKSSNAQTTQKKLCTVKILYLQALHFVCLSATPIVDARFARGPPYG